MLAASKASPALTATAATAAALLLMLGYASLPSAQTRALRHLPTPGSPVGNTLRIMLRHGATIYDWLLLHTKAYGGKPWRLQVVGRPASVVLSTVAGFEDVLKTQFDAFVKGAYTSSTLFDVLGNGIFAVDGALWAHQRKTASHLFSLQMMRDTMEAAVRSHCEVLCARLRKHASGSGTGIGARGSTTFELKRLLDLFTMDVFAEIGFGVDMGGLRGHEDAQFLDAFERASLALLYRFQQPTWLWQLKKALNIGVEGQLKRDMQLINGTINEIIREAMRAADHTASGEQPRRRHNLVALFIEKAPGDAADPALIRDMTLSFIAAGRDTTSQSMTWFLLMMNRYPRVLDKILQELTTKLPHLRHGNATPSMEEVHALTYLEAAIKESIRLNPVVAITSRTAARDVTLYDGTFLKAGTRVVLSNYVMARLPSVWGDDADAYVPERWIDPDSGNVRQVSPYQFAAFLAGPRMCLGMKFSFMEMKITLAALLSKFELRTLKDPFDFTYRAAVTMGVRGPVEMHVRVRDDATA